MSSDVFTYSRAAIMRTAHRYWAMHRVHKWMGHMATFATALQKAWQAAKQEAWAVRTGRTRSSLGIESTLEMCEYLVLA